MKHKLKKSIRIYEVFPNKNDFFCDLYNKRNYFRIVCYKSMPSCAVYLVLLIRFQARTFICNFSIENRQRNKIRNNKKIHK